MGRRARQEMQAFRFDDFLHELDENAKPQSVPLESCFMRK